MTIAIIMQPANASPLDITNGNIISHVTTNASYILNRSCILGLMVAILARIKMPAIIVATI